MNILATNTIRNTSDVLVLFFFFKKNLEPNNKGCDVKGYVRTIIKKLQENDSDCVLYTVALVCFYTHYNYILNENKHHPLVDRKIQKRTCSKMVTPFIPHNKYHRWQLHSTRTLVQYSDQGT